MGQGASKSYTMFLEAESRKNDKRNDDDAITSQDPNEIQSEREKLKQKEHQLTEFELELQIISNARKKIMEDIGENISKAASSKDTTSAVVANTLFTALKAINENETKKQSNISNLQLDIGQTKTKLLDKVLKVKGKNNSKK